MLRWQRPGPGAWDFSQGHKQEGLKVIQSVCYKGSTALRCSVGGYEPSQADLELQHPTHVQDDVCHGININSSRAEGHDPEGFHSIKPDYLFLIGLWPVIQIKLWTYCFHFHHLSSLTWAYRWSPWQQSSLFSITLSSVIYFSFLSFFYLLVCFLNVLKLCCLSCLPCVSPGQMDSPWPPWSDLWVQSKTAGIRRPCYNRRAPTHLLCWSSWGPAGTGSWWGSTIGQMEPPWWKTPWASARRPQKNDNTPCAETKAKAECQQFVIRLALWDGNM